MDDLISRQAAIDEIRTMQTYKLFVGDDMLLVDQAETMTNLMMMPAAEPKWILCSERLPGESGRYLVTRGLNACGSMWNRIYIANYSDLMGIKSEKIWWQGNVGKSDFERLDDVLAWMPLPEPWKGDANGGERWQF